MFLIRLFDRRIKDDFISSYYSEMRYPYIEFLKKSAKLKESNSWDIVDMVYRCEESKEPHFALKQVCVNLKLICLRSILLLGQDCK